jgi:hypothetical protein
MLFATEPHIQPQRQRSPQQPKEIHHPESPQHQARKKTRRLALLRHRAPKQILEPHLAPQRTRRSSGSAGTKTGTTGLASAAWLYPALRHAGGCSTRSTSAVSIYSVSSRSCPSVFDCRHGRRLQFAICYARLRKLRRDRFRHPVQSDWPFLMTG